MRSRSNSHARIQAQAAVSGPRKKCVQKLRKDITPETKGTYIKAFLIWILFSTAGWLSIPEKALPFFSHCVGFGFFLVITTRRTRWLGALAVGGIVFTILLYQTLPHDWISLISQSAGFTGLLATISLACFWRVVPNEIRTELTEEFINTRNDMISRASESLEQLRLSLGIDSLYQSNPPVAVGITRSNVPAASSPLLNEGGQPVVVEEEAEVSEPLISNDGHSDGASDHSSNNSGGQFVFPEGLSEKDRYIFIIQQLDAKLVEMDKEMLSMRQTFSGAVKKITAKLDAETELRLKSEKVIREKEEALAALRADNATLSRQTCGAECIEAKRILVAERDEAQSRTESERGRLQKELDSLALIRQTLEQQAKEMRLVVAGLQRERDQLEVELQSSRDSKSSLGGTVEDLERSVARETTLRLRAERDCEFEKERANRSEALLNSMKTTHEQVLAQLSEAHSQVVSTLEAEIARCKLVIEPPVTTLSLEELAALESHHEKQLREVRAVRTQLLEQERASLKSANEELKEKMLCRVCLTQPIGVILEPCHHVCLCKPCSKSVNACPLCRAAIQSKRSIFV